MAKETFSYTKYFEWFIRDTKNGKRRLQNGNKIKQSTINNYLETQKKIIAFEIFQSKNIRLRHFKSLGRREQLIEIKYWDKFTYEFITFLQEQRLMHSYIGFHLKILKSFHHYLKYYKNIDTGPINKYFSIHKVELPIIVLSPERLKFLIYNQLFRETLSPALNSTLNIFLFGCSTSLRFSDLIHLTRNNLQESIKGVYLVNQSRKTQTETRIKLPDFCLNILKSYQNKKIALFPIISLAQFNRNLKLIFELAGWTEETPKMRDQGGTLKQIKTSKGKNYRFCDLASSHLMRKTAITNMLLMGMPENLVRKISGHAPNSKEFYRYVKYSQSFLDDYTDKVFERLAAL